MTSGVFHTISVDSITIAEGRQRKIRSASHIPNLANSIRELGLIHPIVITRDHLLVAGECRFRAIRDELNWTHISCQYQDELEPWMLFGIELEENIKREDLDWRDRTNAIVTYHELRKANDPTWSQSRTADAIGLSQPAIQSHLIVAANLDDPDIANAVTFAAARNFARRREERRAADAAHTHNPVIHTSPILTEDFNIWALLYNGPKFNLLHCDFPYGIDAHKSVGQGSTLPVEYDDSPVLYWQLLKTLTVHLDNFCAESAHIIMWFSPTQYCQTWELLKLLKGFRFDEHPLIWAKGHEGIAPDPQRRPRRVYEMAFFGWRGDRKIVRTKPNFFLAPTERDRHPHEKSEAALMHFMEMCVDANTRLLDPTCGSGSALRAARALGATTVLGLESNPEYADIARRSLSQSSGGL